MWLNKALGATAVSGFMSAVTGHPYSVSTLTEAGERIANVRQAFNIREGLNPLERRVPGRVIGIPPQTEGPLAGKTVDLDARVNAYLKAMDWDPETAKPGKKRLCQLGLEDVANAL
jgi:aldehyde:ferredoxin oxidoreductase